MPIVNSIIACRLETDRYTLRCGTRRSESHSIQPCPAIHAHPYGPDLKLEGSVKLDSKLIIGRQRISLLGRENYLC